MPYPEKFEGWLGHSPDCAAGKMQWGEFEPKIWEEGDVDIEVSHCGICGSDIHTLKSGWGETPYRKLTPLAGYRQLKREDGY
jgi:alcohol dehydrogenase (NADP+)